MIYLAPGALVIAALVLLLSAWGEPRYSNPDWEQPLLGSDLSTEESRQRATERFYETQARNLTPAAHRSDVGWVL